MGNKPNIPNAPKSVHLAPARKPNKGKKKEDITPDPRHLNEKNATFDSVSNGEAFAKGGDAPIPKKKPKLEAGTPEHKAKSWEDYQARGGKWSYERWSKQYDTNIKNAKYGISREKAYRQQLSGKSETIKTPFTYRQIDIYKSDEMYMGQLKTGKICLTSQAKIDIQKDAYLVQQGNKVEYILEKGASKPFLKALKDNGIDIHIGSKIK